MKKFIAKCALFSVVCTLFCLPSVSRKHCSFPELDSLDSELRRRTPVILFGSSVNEHSAATDTDERSVAEMLDSMLPETGVAGISHGAYHMDVYVEFVSYIAKTGRKPLLVIPINLRTFSPEWDMRPNYQFIRERALLNPQLAIRLGGIPILRACHYPLTGATAFRSISKHEFNNSPVFHGDRRVGLTSEYDFTFRHKKRGYDRNSEMRKGFIYHYMQPLTESHRKLASLSEICRVANDHDIPLITYITPIDYQHAEEAGIEGFRSLQETNTEVIGAVTARHGHTPLDLTMRLPSSCFDYQYRPCEHLNMHGREVLAQELADAVANLCRSKPGSAASKQHGD